MRLFENSEQMNLCVKIGMHHGCQAATALRRQYKRGVRKHFCSQPMKFSLDLLHQGAHGEYTSSQSLPATPIRGKSNAPLFN
jgi:hypothetical protein